MLSVLPVFIIFMFSLAVQADTQITINDSRGSVSKMTSDGKKARLDNLGDQIYAIINFKSGQFLTVYPERQEVMDMNTNEMPEVATAGGSGRSVKVSLDKKGQGPNIAGYKTKEYALSANGQYCGSIFGSKELLKKKAVSELFEFMNHMHQQSMKMMGAYQGNADVCEQAKQDVPLSFKKTGLPLRMLDARGRVESEVTKVKTGKNIDAAYYEIPVGYKVFSVADQMNAASQQMMLQMGENGPDMNELMEQMQGQGGEVPPELMEQLEQSQEMMKQDK